ncbi:MAG: hypothetical protein IT353_17080 [Gemmatimonadaceae bacterium]|nr:hypothetical protein [Gemmatimonadaceae bacterium]
MTAGQSTLSVPGLDSVIIDDTRVTNVIDRGRTVLTRVHLGANDPRGEASCGMSRRALDSAELVAQFSRRADVVPRA